MCLVRVFGVPETSLAVGEQESVIIEVWIESGSEWDDVLQI